MNWQDAAETVGKYAPALGGMLYGPAGAGAGTLIARALGVDDTPKAVAQAVQADPQAALKLQELENEMELAYIDAEVADRDSARDLHATALENGKGEFQNWLAAGVLLGGVIMLGAVAFLPMDGLSDNIRMYILGFLTAAMTQVLNYFFGSTQWGNKNARGTDSAPRAGIFEHLKTRR